MNAASTHPSRKYDPLNCLSRLPCVIIVDASIGRTGAFICAQNMAKAIMDYSHTLLVVPMEADFTADDIAPFNGFVKLPLRLHCRALPARLKWLLAVIPSGVQLRALINQTQATHLILNDFYLIQGIICRLLGFRGQIITWVRVQPKRTGGYFTVLLWHLIGLSSNRVVAVSSFVERQIPKWLNPTLIYDTLSSYPVLRTNPVRFGRLVYIGNFMPGKGQNYAIEAFALIADQYPKALLEFYGDTLGVASNAIWLKQLQRRCTALGLEQRIFFHGPYTNPFDPLQGADIALNFSDSETFSLTVLEALSAGVPVIATNSGGPAELIDDQVTGVLVPIGDTAAMAKAMTERLSDLDATAVMGVAAARSMSNRFSMETYRNQVLALLKL